MGRGGQGSGGREKIFAAVTEGGREKIFAAVTENTHGSEIGYYFGSR
jgi:hypothetical protein